MATDISLFLSFIAFSVLLGIVGIWTRIYFLMLIGGALITFLAILPMDFVNGTRIDELDTTTDIIIPSYEDDPVQIDIYPKIFFGLMGSMFMIGGALAWRTDKE